MSSYCCKVLQHGLRGLLYVIDPVPVSAALEPVKVNLEAGKRYRYCRCGRSRTQPFCDGSHFPGVILPQGFGVEKTGDQLLCQCKRTKSPPYCDGSHAKPGGKSRI